MPSSEVKGANSSPLGRRSEVRAQDLAPFHAMKDPPAPRVDPTNPANAVAFGQIALPSIRGHTQDRRKTALHIRLGRCPRRHADPHRCVTLPDCATAPTSAIALDTRNHLARAL